MVHKVYTNTTKKKKTTNERKWSVFHMPNAAKDKHGCTTSCRFTPASLWGPWKLSGDQCDKWSMLCER